jgi:hypothetical protein
MANADHSTVKENPERNSGTRNRKKPAAPEATRDPKLNDAEKTPGSGMAPDDQGDAPTG